MPQQTIPALGVIRLEIPTKREIAVLTISNESALNVIRYKHLESAPAYGDVIQPGGFRSYIEKDGDYIPQVFYVAGTNGQTFSVSYSVKR